MVKAYGTQQLFMQITVVHVLVNASQLVIFFSSFICSFVLFLHFILFLGSILILVCVCVYVFNFLFASGFFLIRFFFFGWFWWVYFSLYSIRCYCTVAFVFVWFFSVAETTVFLLLLISFAIFYCGRTKPITAVDYNTLYTITSLPAPALFPCAKHSFHPSQNIFKNDLMKMNERCLCCCHIRSIYKYVYSVYLCECVCVCDCALSAYCFCCNRHCRRCHSRQQRSWRHCQPLTSLKNGWWCLNRFKIVGPGVWVWKFVHQFSCLLDYYCVYVYACVFLF